MKYVLEVDNLSNLKALVIQDLKELGIKLPKAKKGRNKDESLNTGHNAVFGNILSSVPSEIVEGCGPVPRFLVDAVRVLEKHVDVEGLFRKSGSLARQKELKSKAECGAGLGDANPLDMASLVKQFFRELPDSLLTARLHDTLLKCHSVECEDTRLTAILLLCHLLPWHNLSTLRFIMLFLHKVADYSDQNKMDVPNLSVCLTPNLMHANGKGDRMNTTESKNLLVQTNIVQLLIEQAEYIGMVPDSLCERAALMSACFPASEDELDMERSDNGSQDDSKMKKKKRRSGSLGGLVSNLSSSFSKWRSKDGKNHNVSSISDKSSMSYLSFDKTSMLSVAPDAPDSSSLTSVHNVECLDAMHPEATPKLMRKRKADEDAVPFSASKKKAILQNMPQMSTLGSTPFTPHHSRRGRIPSEFMDTPNIKFADHSDMTFNAAATPHMVTPRRKMDKLFSPNSTSKMKRTSKSQRHSSGKSGCFSPKTGKGSVRRTMKGFFRRLSGGKEAQSPSCSGELIEQTLAGVPDSLTIMDPTAGQKKRTFFRRHKKTPSSPARMVTLFPQEMRREKALRAAQGSASTIQSESAINFNEEGDMSYSNAELSAKLGEDLQLMSPIERNEDIIEVSALGDSRLHKRGYSADGSNNLSTSLRRGKPNSLKTGLPTEYAKRRSIETNCLPNMTSEVRQLEVDTLETVPNAIDTSPILAKDSSSSSGTDGGSSCEPSTVTAIEESGQALCRQLSTHSVTSVVSVQMEELLDDHERAFINESMLATDQDDSPAQDESMDDLEHLDALEQHTPKHQQQTPEQQLFKKPLEPSKHTVRHMSEDDMAPYKQAVHKHSPSAESLDSVDSAVRSITPTGDTGSGMTKYDSVQSLVSCDSGLGSNCSSVESLSKDNLRTPIGHRGGASLGRDNGCKDETNMADQSIRVCRREAFMTGPQQVHEPHLHISADMHNMLAKVGVMGDADKITHTQLVALPDSDWESLNAVNIDDLDSQDPRRESILHLQQARKVTQGLQQFSREAGDTKELVERHACPLRFPNSSLRRKLHSSPVRIPTVFAKKEVEAAAYRELARAAIMGRSPAKPSSAIKKPILPISTNLVRSGSVKAARSKLSSSKESKLACTSRGVEVSPELSLDNTQGHTPLRVPHKSRLHKVDIQEPLNSDCCTPAGNARSQSRAKAPLRDSNVHPDTPRIRPLLLSNDATKKLLNKASAAQICNAVSGTMNTDSPATSTRRYRSPVKPVKRLKSGSPRSYSKSPQRYPSSPVKGACTQQRLSPMPKHIQDWDI